MLVLDDTMNGIFLADFGNGQTHSIKQFVGCYQQIVWVCLTILWSWCLKGKPLITQPISCHWSLLYPLKTSKNLWYSVFRAYRKRLLTWNGLIVDEFTKERMFVSGCKSYSQKIETAFPSWTFMDIY